MDDSFSFVSADGFQGNVLANDTPGQTINLEVISFGGGDLGFSFPRGEAAPLGAGAVQIDADGAIAVSPGIVPGNYTFEYTIVTGNPGVATVTLTVT